MVNGINHPAVRTFNRLWAITAEKLAVCQEADAGFDGGEFSGQFWDEAYDKEYDDAICLVADAYDIPARTLYRDVQDAEAYHEHRYFNRSV